MHLFSDLAHGCLRRFRPGDKNKVNTRNKAGFTKAVSLSEDSFGSVSAHGVSDLFAYRDPHTVGLCVPAVWAPINGKGRKNGSLPLTVQGSESPVVTKRVGFFHPGFTGSAAFCPARVFSPVLFYRLQSSFSYGSRELYFSVFS